MKSTGKDPTMLSSSCLREIAELGQEAEDWMMIAVESDAEEGLAAGPLRSPIQLQRLRNTYATLNRALKAVEAVGKKYQGEVARIERNHR